MDLPKVITIGIILIRHQHTHFLLALMPYFAHERSPLKGFPMQAMDPQKISSNQALKQMFGKLSAKNMIYYGFFWSAYLFFWAAHIAMVGVMTMIPSLWLYKKILTDSSQWWQYLACGLAAVAICAFAVHYRPRVTFQKKRTQA